MIFIKLEISYTLSECVDRSPQRGDAHIEILPWDWEKLGDSLHTTIIHW